MMRLLFSLLLISVLFVSGCSLLDRQVVTPEATTVPEEVTPEPTPLPEETPQSGGTESDQKSIINVWVLDVVNPDPGVPGGSLLGELLTIFETNRADLEVNVEVKARSGQGNALSYLRSGRNVAPSVLPDLIVIPSDQLNTAVAEQLIFPIDNLIVPGAIADLFPAAQTMAQIDGISYGYPFAVYNLTHLAFSTSTFRNSFPTNWDELVEDEEAILALPGAGPQGAELVLQHYLALGGSLTNEAGQPTLELEPLSDALTLIREGRREGLLPFETTNISVLSESWQTFRNGTANLVQTDFRQYSNERAEISGTGFAGIPGPQEPIPPLVDTWLWAISTPDPGRRTLVADLLNWLIAAPNLGDWSLAAGTLPARRSAFEQWPADDDYFDFVQEQLELAQPYPFRAERTINDALSVALFDVLSLSKTPRQAAQATIDSLNQ